MLTPFQKGQNVQENRQEVSKFVSIVKMVEMCQVYPVLLNIQTQ